jgi:DNA-binding MurR/RpiR family transcriptional regulator
MSEHPPPRPADLPAHIRSRLPALPGLARTVAQQLLDDPAGCARLSLGELAERVDTSEATVARTARLLGYRGFRELRMALLAAAAAAGPGPDTAGPALLGPVSAADDLDTVVAKLSRDERESLTDTERTLDTAVLRRVVALVAEARRVDLYGLMSSGLVAQDLAQKLLRIGVAAQAHTELHLAVTSALQLGPEDVAIGISHSGTTTEVIEPLQHARANGAAAVALTGNDRAPLAAAADHVLFASQGRETELPPVALASRTSQLLVTDCLFIGVAKARPGAVEALRTSQDALAPKHRPRARPR